jgi:general stress protein 26
MEQEKERELAYGFFRQHPLMTVSTVSSDGVPQNAAVYVYMDKGMNCYFATRANTRKAANIQANSVATLCAYNENLLMFGEVSGTATLLEDKEEVAALLPKLQKILESRKSTYYIPPVAQLEGDGYVFFKVTPKTVTFANYELSSSENPEPTLFSFAL